MRQLIFICVISCILGLRGYAEVSVLQDSLDIGNLIEKGTHPGGMLPMLDTTWFVNYGYNPEDPAGDGDKARLRLKLKDLPAEIAYVDVNIHTMNPVTGEEISEKSLSNVHIDGRTGDALYFTQDIFLPVENNELLFTTGLYYMEIILCDTDGNPLYLAPIYLFNTFPQVRLEIFDRPENNQLCINQQPNLQDTFIFVVRDHLMNPPGTKYNLEVKPQGDRPQGENSEDLYKIEPELKEPDQVRDSFVVLIKKSLGMNGASIRVTAECVNKQNKSQKIRNWYLLSEMITTFDRPNIEEIFGLSKGLPLEDILACTGEPVKEFKYDSISNEVYMDRWNRPDYWSRNNFDVRYFRKMKDKDQDGSYANWNELTKVEIEKYIESDSVEFVFAESGLYRIRMEASNMCGKDTMDTDPMFLFKSGVVLGPGSTIPGPGERKSDVPYYIKVYQLDIDHISMANPLICLSENPVENVLTIRDKSARLDWEDPFEYVLSAVKMKRPQGDTIMDVDDIFERPVITPYLGGNPVAPGMKGCDSTIIRIPVKKIGTYEFELIKKNTLCEKNITLNLRIAKVPELPEMFLSKVHVENLDRDTLEMNVKLCGLFNYQLPSVLSIDSCNAMIKPGDGYLWAFGKGSQRFTATNAEPSYSGGIFVFDSVIGPTPLNYVSLKARNECGWSEVDSVAFYTYALPEVKLLRDGVENNNVLCKEAGCDYYFSGKFPDKFEITISYVNGGGGTLSTTDSVGEGWGWYFAAGKFKELFRIRNQHHQSCVQFIESEVKIVETPAINRLAGIDTVLFCNSLTEISVSEFVGIGSPSYITDLNWKKIKPQEEIISSGVNLPIVDVTGSEETVITYHAINEGGCYKRDTFVLRALPEPVLTLDKSSLKYCRDQLINLGPEISVPDQIPGHMISGINDAIQLTVLAGVDTVYSTPKGIDRFKSYTYPDGIDTLRVYYSATNGNNYPVFGKNCDINDTLKIKIFQPEISFLKNRDTLRSVDQKYDFSVVKYEAKDVTGLHWEIDNGSGSFEGDITDILNCKYQCSDNEPDTLKFVLKGNKEFCGGEVCDTLKVWIPQAELFANDIAICTNTDGYLLWSDNPQMNKIYGYFIDETSLIWSVVGAGGRIDGTGKDARFVPELVNFDMDAVVTVNVKAKSSVSGLDFEKTFEVTMPKRLYMQIKPSYVDMSSDNPLVLVMSDSLAFDDVCTIKNSGVFGGYEWKSVRGIEYGKVSGKKYYKPTYDIYGNYSDTLVVEMKSLNASCPDPTDTLFLKVYSKLGVSVISADENKICEDSKKGFSGGVDGLSDMVTLSWSSESGKGTFENQNDVHITVDFIAGATEHEKVILEAKISDLTNYRGEVKTLHFKDAADVEIWLKNTFVIKQNPATVCAGIDVLNLNNYVDFTLAPTWENVLLESNGLIRQTLPLRYKWMISPSGEEEQALITLNVANENCPDWDKTEILQIKRIARPKGEIATAGAACAGFPFEIIGTVNTSDFEWAVEGGTLINETTLTPTVNIASGADKVIIKLFVDDPVCGAERVEVVKEIPVIAIPVIELKDSTVCEDVLYQLTYTNSDQVASVVWTTSGSGFFSGANPLRAVYTPSVVDITTGHVVIEGQFTLKEGCTGVLKKWMTLTFQKKPEITDRVIAKKEVCQGDSLVIDVFDVMGEGGYNWNSSIGNESLSGDTTLTPKLFAGDFGGSSVRLTLTAEGLHGCPSVSKDVDIDIISAPAPQIHIDKEDLCLNDDKVLNVSPVANSYSWTINSRPPSVGGDQNSFGYIFNRVGKDTVAVELTYANGCVRTSEKVITTHNNPFADFVFDYQTFSDPGGNEIKVVGAGKKVVFKNKFDNPGNDTIYYWYVNSSTDGIVQKDFQHTFNMLPGTPTTEQTVRLKAENEFGCTASAQYKLSTVSLPELKDVDFVVSDRCDSTRVLSITNDTKGDFITWTWDLQTDVSGMDTTLKLPVLPAGRDLIYRASAYRDTTYQVVMTATNPAGIARWTKDINVVSRLTPGFKIITDNEGCAPVDRKILNTSVGQADSYRIDWGDGNVQNLGGEDLVRPVSHKYVNDTDREIKYTIRMVAENVCEKDSVGADVIIYPNNAIAIISPGVQGSSVCYGSEITFKNNSEKFVDGKTTYLWLFEENETPVVKNDKSEVGHIFQKPGVYDIRLVAEDICNKDTSDVFQILVKGNDSLDIAIKENVLCDGKYVEIALAPAKPGKPTFYSLNWKFKANGDAREVVTEDLSGSGKKWRVKYSEPGDYQISLSAVAEQCQSYTGKFITVGKNPEALFSLAADKGCQPLTMSFNSVGDEAGGTRMWDFNDQGATSPENNIPHTFMESGIYKVKLKIELDGCIDSLEKQITVNPTPKATFALSDSLFCSTDGNISFVPTNTTENMALNSYKWNIKDRIITAQQPNRQQFEGIWENIKVKLTASNALGCVDSLSKYVISAPKVVAEIGTTQENVCGATPVEFVDKSVNHDTIYWYMGDQVVRTDEKFVHEYSIPGVYPIRVVAASKYGCRDTLRDSITVHAKPEADFTYEMIYGIIDAGLKLPDGIDQESLPKVNNGGIRFLSTSVLEEAESGDFLKYHWDFGDTTTSVGTKEQLHRYQTNGQYQVKLLVESKYGCKDSVTDVVSIDAVKGLFVPNAFAPATGVAENPGTALFLPKGIGLYSYKMQVFDSWSGTCVWSTDKLEDGSPAEGWDGTKDGNPLAKGVYLWKISAVFIDGSVWTGESGKTEGFVSLIR